MKRKIFLEIEITGVEEWNTIWDSYIHRSNELKTIERDIKHAMYHNLGILHDNISIKSKLVSLPLKDEDKRE